MKVVVRPVAAFLMLGLAWHEVEVALHSELAGLEHVPEESHAALVGAGAMEVSMAKQEAGAGTKYVYKKIREHLSEAQLNALGADGWLLIAGHEQGNPDDAFFLFVKEVRPAVGP
ncbi:MAG: hypothetical protein L0216_18355 [Planctomycetales bacterium]|nr:hypothetical protein [Planctomycetales bacterium]